MVRGRCVAAAVFRHVPAASRREGWSELLLLAVRRDEERRGYGTAMVEYVRRLSAASGASLLVVISNGSAFWQRPALRLGELAAAEAGRYPCFVPWSHGIKLLGSRCEAERSAVASLVNEAPLVVRPQLRQPAFEDKTAMSVEAVETVEAVEAVEAVGAVGAVEAVEAVGAKDAEATVTVEAVEAVAVEAVEAVAVEADALLWEGEQEAVVVDEEQEEAALTMEAPLRQQPAKRQRRGAEARANGADTGGAARGAPGMAISTTTATTATAANTAAATADAAADAAANTFANAADAAEQTWAQCEDCEKWRRVRGGQPTSRRWRCHDNRNDALHASCDVPQAIVSIAMVGRMVGRATVISPVLPASRAVSRRISL
jgi:hypothetical protein